MSWFDPASDRAFGPQFKDKFDFTLQFEHTILAILPATMFVAAVPIFFFFYQNAPNVVRPGQLLLVKLATALTLLAVETTSLVLWSKSNDQFSSDGVAALSLLCLAALSLIPVIYWEHQRTLQSTAFIAIWLFVTVLCDCVRTRSYFLRSGLSNIGICTVVAASLKVVLLGLQEWSKTSLIVDEKTREKSGKEATCGFISRTLFVWINKMFFFGFRNILQLKELDDLGPAFGSRLLLDKLDSIWLAGHGRVSGSLELACLRACLVPWLGAAFPRLCQSVFTVCQPLLLMSVVKYVQDEHKTTGHRDGLIVAATFVYGGLALSKANYDHLAYRIATQVRGMLLSQASRKALKLKYAEAQNTANVTLMNADIMFISIAIPRLHRMWTAILELAVNLYVLTTIVGPAASLVTFTIVVTAAGSHLVGKNMPSAQKEWNAVISSRVAKTAKMLSQIKAVKMTGLEDVMATYVQKLRENEVEHSKNTRIWLLRLYVVGTFCDCITSPIVLAGGIFWTSLGGDFTPANVFTTLAVVTLIGSILKYFPDEYALIQGGRASLKRFEEYLALEEWQDPRHTDLATFATEVIAQNAAEGEDEGIVTAEMLMLCTSVIEFYNASIAVEGTEKNVFVNLNISIERHEIVMVVGPTGCGKSTFLRAILGEIELHAGALYVESGSIAFCDQTAWVWNATIQANIIGNSPVDMEWYSTVVDACLLRKDFRNLAQGDQTQVGSNGGNLSGGQKQRVALARAVYKRASYLVLDDLLAALDRQTASQIFARLFGAYGLVKQSRTTVIMATHSIQFLSSADRILVIDKEHKVTMRTDIAQVVRSEQVQTICREISKQQRYDEDYHEAACDVIAAAPFAQAPPFPEDIERQKRDPTLYGFYFRTFPVIMAILWFAWTTLAVIAEVFTDGYVRIWMEVDPKNKLFYIGYVLIGASAAIFMGMKISKGNVLEASAILFAFSSPHAFGRNDKVTQLIRRRQDAIKKLTELRRAKLSFLTSTDHGSLVNRISQDLTLISQQLPMGFMRTIYYLLRVVCRFSLIIAVTRYTVLSFPAAVGIIFAIQLFFLRTMRQLRYLDLEAKAPLVAQFAETATGLYHIRAFGWQHHNLEKTLELLDDSQKPYYYLYAAERWLGLVMDTVSLCLAVMLISLTVWLQYLATASGVGLSMLALITLSFDTTSFVREWMLMEASFGALARTRDFVQNTPLEEDPEVTVKTHARWPQRGRIVMKDVVAKYDRETEGPPVLNNVSLVIPPHAKVGLVGRTGSGKSSILLTLLGFLDYTGQITIDGVDISRIPRQKLRSVITAISQEDLDLEGTVRYNLFPETEDPESSKRAFNDDTAKDLLTRLGLGDILAREKGLDTRMGDLGLSHGEKQLMSIARSCIRHFTYDTRIIVMDEATSNLDHGIQEDVLAVFKDIFRDCTILTVAHRTETLEGYDMRVDMADGKLVSVSHLSSRTVVQAITSERRLRQPMLVAGCMTESEKTEPGPTDKMSRHVSEQVREIREEANRKKAGGRRARRRWRA